MKNVVSIVVFAVVFLGLGAMALMAAPGGADLVAEFNPSETAGSAPQAANLEVSAASKLNHIAMPLDSTAQFADAGQPFKASGLAGLMGGGVEQVLLWDASQTPAQYLVFNSAVPPQFTDDFDLHVGGSYFLLVDSTAATTLSFVGDVPAQGAVSNSLYGGTTACALNSIILPLDQSSVAKASDLAVALGGASNVGQVLEWDAASQNYASSYNPSLPPEFTDDFDLQIGYPYMVCLNSGVAQQWP